jgi:hypothetical protein
MVDCSAVDRVAGHAGPPFLRDLARMTAGKEMTFFPSDGSPRRRLSLDRTDEPDFYSLSM